MGLNVCLIWEEGTGKHLVQPHIVNCESKCEVVSVWIHNDCVYDEEDMLTLMGKEMGWQALLWQMRECWQLAFYLHFIKKDYDEKESVFIVIFP